MAQKPDSRLGEAMQERRLELRMTWVQVANDAHLSIAGLSLIRKGERQPTDLTKRGIEWALWWEAGSVDAVLSGGQPSNAMPHRVPTSWPEGTDLRVPESLRLAVEAGRYTDPAERAIWALDDLSEDERRRFIEELRESRRRAGHQSNA